MAPKRRGGRPSKMSERSEVAMEHMVKMGFEYEHIAKTLKKLLKEYGEEGWWFIETEGYKELIQALLPEEGNPSLENCNGNANLLDMVPMDNNIVEVPVAAVAGKSVPSLLTSASNAMDAVASPICAVEDLRVPLSPPSPPVNKDTIPIKIAARIEDMQVTLSAPFPKVNKDPVPKKSARRIEDMQVTLSAPTPLVNKGPVPKKTARRIEDLQGPLPPPSPTVKKDSVPIKTARRRRPCYGWISDDDDGGEIVELPTAAGAWRN